MEINQFLIVSKHLQEPHSKSVHSLKKKKKLVHQKYFVISGDNKKKSPLARANTKT